MPKKAPPIYSEEFCRKVDRQWKVLFAAYALAVAFLLGFAAGTGV